MHPSDVIPFSVDEWEAIHWALSFRWQGEEDFVAPKSAPREILRNPERNEELIRKVENARRMQAQREAQNAAAK